MTEKTNANSHSTPISDSSTSHLYSSDQRPGYLKSLRTKVTHTPQIINFEDYIPHKNLFTEFGLNPFKNVLAEDEIYYEACEGLDMIFEDTFVAFDEMDENGTNDFYQSLINILEIFNIVNGPAVFVKFIDGRYGAYRTDVEDITELYKTDKLSDLNIELTGLICEGNPEFFSMYDCQYNPEGYVLLIEETENCFTIVR